jgi:SAM-dependent methyltransferase
MKILQHSLRILALGRAPQSFIGARWIPQLLKAFPPAKRKWLALRLLALSPHYFYRDANQEYVRLSLQEFLEAECVRNNETRQMIYERILKRFLTGADRVLDYGCGPGFLARIVAANVTKVYAMDISPGLLECAKIINSAESLEYLLVDQADCVPSSSLDVIYSFAVIQHMTDEAFEQALILCSDKLKRGGRIVFQVQLSDSKWRTERQWRADSSINGRLKFRYALHLFARNPDYFLTVLPKFGFRVLSLAPISDLCGTLFDDICAQQLLLAERTSDSCSWRECDSFRTRGKASVF